MEEPQHPYLDSPRLEYILGGLRKHLRDLTRLERESTLTYLRENTRYRRRIAGHGLDKAKTEMRAYIYQST